LVTFLNLLTAGPASFFLLRFERTPVDLDAVRDRHHSRLSHLRIFDEPQQSSSMSVNGMIYPQEWTDAVLNIFRVFLDVVSSGLLFFGRRNAITNKRLKLTPNSHTHPLHNSRDYLLPFLSVSFLH